MPADNGCHPASLHPRAGGCGRIIEVQGSAGGIYAPQSFLSRGHTLRAWFEHRGQAAVGYRLKLPRRQYHFLYGVRETAVKNAVDNYRTHRRLALP